MADPLSITASVTGLLSVAGKVCTIISGFISNVSDAPASARAALAAVEEMRMVLTSVRKVMDSLMRLPAERKEMIHVRHLVITFREAIQSFSELEAVVSPAAGSADGRSSKWDRVKWVLEEERITRSVQRLELHKNSLSTMLSILHCESGLEAQKSYNNLEEMMKKILDQNEALTRRLEEYGISCAAEAASVRFFDDNQSMIAGRDPSADFPSLLPQILEDSVSLEASINSAISPREFEVILERTRVYMGIRSNDSDMSFDSSAVRTNAWSLLSGISLNDISVISVIALPISLEEITSIGPDLTFAKFMSSTKELVPKRSASDGSLPNPQQQKVVRRARRQVQPALGKTVELFKRSQKGHDTTMTPRVNWDDPLSRPSGTSVGSLGLYKLVVLGDGGVDKTALVIQFCLNHFVKTYDPTIEDSYRKRVIVDGKACMVEIADTTRQEEYTGLLDRWIRNGEGFLLVYSITNRDSFERVRKFHRQVQSVKDHQREWQTVQGYRFLANGPPIMLVGNKSEQQHERQVSTQEGQVLANELGCGFVETSCKNCVNVEKAFVDVVRMIRRQRMLAVPTADNSDHLGDRFDYF
ncbi:RAS2 protein [Cladophialophora chaetospira]|uniref:RAS2 protein n=1 Tax=Cladophialophora chaetospira TaxID=386627 RepID=A0AA38XDL6_9EURO|nr:RAS2 protein [Cladophialophora chaetospira]